MSDFDYMAQRYGIGRKQPMEDLNEDFSEGELKRRQRVFDRLASYVYQHGGWVTGIRGDHIFRFDALPESDLPDALRSDGHKLSEEPKGQRCLPSAIIESLVRRPNGTLMQLAVGSSEKPDVIRTHAGIIAVRRWSFGL